ncbi:hypothetical protein [Streptantibioticus silvisoli]|uniref:DUF222 domain-containing protein n=1 Tax=Streptantibioticus silvisoli TaxID=2705255 RepID=A0ABT6W747_9ACTN|nr:hypothetical protein [Streptantibioticus silvisoli]MDI5965807.1 hypothetical protein [Streptantibioticus silvisoli]
MTGPEHYLEAERLLCDATDNDGDITATSERITATLTAAQVHATLALAAATAGQLADRYVGDGDHINAWRTAANGDAK